MPLYEGIGLINEKYPIVLEIGRRWAKVGFAGEPAPRAIIPSVAGKKLFPETIRYLHDYKSAEDLYVMMVEFLQHVYYKILLVTPKDRKVVVVESVFCPTEWRQTLARTLYLHFEVLHVLWLPIQIASVASTGHDTALVLDIGVEEASIIPIFRGVTLLNASISFALGSKAFDASLKETLKENCVNPPANLDELLSAESLEDFRTRCCFISSDKDLVVPNFKHLMKDHMLELDGKARHAAAEVWFNNQDLDGESLPRMIIDCLRKCPIDTRRVLAQSILLVGGTAMLPGFHRRIFKDLKELEGGDCNSKDPMDKLEYKFYKALTHPNIVPWVGGAIYGATESVTVRGVAKEFFLKNEIVPDWSNLSFSSYQVLGSTDSTPTPLGTPLKTS